MAALLISQTALENLSVNASSGNLPRDLTEPLDQTTCYKLFLFLGRRQDMDPVSLYDAKTHLSSLVDRAAAGEEIVIAKNGIPRAKLVPLPDQNQPRKPAGALGVTYIAPDFNAPDPDTLALFEQEN
jgi:prevent-host-death family protein